MRFRDRVAIVTGGSRGIGSAIVGELSRGGARVFFTYRKNKEAADAVAEANGASAVQCSQTDTEAVERTVDTVASEAGGVDILVNNAGITADQFLMMMPFEDWNKVIDTNLHGLYRWSKAVCRPMLQARRGAIVNVASVAGLIGTPGQTNYSATKGAILAFTRSMAAEVANRGVRVNAVVPGFVDTDMTAAMPRRTKRESVERIALGRFGTAQEIANAVSFLASDEASYITGQSLVVDGGLTSVVPQ
jgi:3-oxoacyl-[acyl-carrier protein] reductase